MSAISSSDDDRISSPNAPTGAPPQLFLNAITDCGLCTFDAGGYVTSWNEGAQRIDGYSESEILGQHYSIFFTEDDRHAGEPNRVLAIADATGRYAAEAWRVRKDGTPYRANILIQPIYDEAKRLLGFARIIRDVNDQWEASQAAATLEAVFEHGPDAIVLIDRSGTIRRANDQTARLFGYTRDELVGKPVEILLPERLSPTHAAHRVGFFADPRRREMGSGLDLSGRHADGSEFPIDVMISPLDLQTDVMAIAIVRDVTERKRAEIALQTSERHYRLLLESVVEYGVYRLDPNGIVTSWNAGAERIKGYTADEIVGKHFSVFFTTEDRLAGLPETVLRTAAEKGRYAEEAQRVRKDGTVFWADVVIDAIRDDAGNLIGFAKVVRDVTARRNAEAELQETRRQQAILEERERGLGLLRQTSKRLAGIVEASPLAISLIGPDDTIEMWNPAAERMYGESAAKIIGQRFQDVIAAVPGDDPEVSLPLLDAIRQQGHVLGVRRRRLNAHGQAIELRVSGALVHDNEIGPASVLFMAEDVTERVGIEQQLRQAQKMDAIGQLTGGVAHDFNNLLAIIGGNVELLRDTVASNPSLTGLVDDAIAAVERGGSLTHRLLAYARQQQLAPSLIDVAQLVMTLSEVLRRLMEESIRIDTNTASDLWKCRIDAHQLENALLNLAVNARDAMPDGGHLTISAENAILDAHYASQYAEVSAGAYVLVSVSDTGIGMPKEVVERALEPFFTTKPVGRGTGLGLSMVYGFVKQSGGHMKIYSEPGRGTTIKLYLPKADSMTVEPDATNADTPTTHTANNRLILVVEDDDAVRRLQLRVLTSLGYRTLEAADGPAGLALLDAHPEIDLLLTDVVLPNGMTGNAVARAARMKRPELKIVFMSGYATNAVIRGDELSGEFVLSKPFTRATLASALQQAFGRGG